MPPARTGDETATLRPTGTARTRLQRLFTSAGRPLALMTIVVGFLATSAWLYRPWWEMSLRSDGSPASWLSSALLLTAAGLMLRLTKDRSLPAAFGTLVALGLFALALDEQFMFHERLKHGRLAVDSPWADANVWLLLAAAPIFGFLFNRHVSDARPRRLMVLALATGGLALVVDIAPSPGMHWLKIFEEALEVLAETLFVAALLEMPPPGIQVQSASMP